MPSFMQSVLVRWLIAIIAFPIGGTIGGTIGRAIGGPAAMASGPAATATPA